MPTTHLTRLGAQGLAVEHREEKAGQRIFVRREQVQILVPSYWSGWPGVAGFENRESVTVPEETVERWAEVIRRYGDVQREIETALRGGCDEGKARR